MKQRTIHEKREDRKHLMVRLETELEMNEVLLPRFTSYINATLEKGSSFARTEAARMKEAPSNDRPERSTGPTYDQMMLSLLLQIADDSTVKSAATEEERVQAIVKLLQKHREDMVKRSEDARKELALEKAEQSKHITSEDVHVGFDSGHVNKNAQSAQPVDPALKKKDTKGKAKEAEIEVLNPSSVVHSSLADNPPTDSGNLASDSSDASDAVPDLTPNLLAFSKIPCPNWEAQFKAISNDSSLLQDEAVDALLMEAFTVCGKTKPDLVYARQCVNQALLIQYCGKLGKDGVSLFFKRMAQPGKGRQVFEDDVKATFERIQTRSKALAEERAAKGEADQEEAIQLVASDPNTKIGFNVPAGPPPEHLVLEGEGTEDLDIEEVRQFLQAQWDTFSSFPKNLQKALKKGDLDSVNKVLAKMNLDQAQEVVQQLDEAKILSFKDGGAEVEDEPPTSA